MPNLDKRIAEWRRRMKAGGIKSPAVLDELESHLRDEVEQQMRSGLDAQESLAVAADRIGQADILKIEFETIGELPSARERKVTGILLLAALGLYAALGLLIFFTAKASLTERTTMLAAVAFTVLTGLSGRLFLHRFLPVVARKRHRIIVQVVILQGGRSIFHSSTGLDFTPGRLVTTILWE
jgi:hypothetical protein